MTRNTSVILGDHHTAFVEQQVALGRYGSVSEVMRAALRLLEEHEVNLETLRLALIEGEESGVATSLDVERFLAAKRTGQVQ